VETIAPSALAAPIVGLNLRGDTLRAHLGAGATLLVFLRHLG
jgi:hypothetical protein